MVYMEQSCDGSTSEIVIDKLLCIALIICIELQSVSLAAVGSIVLYNSRVRHLYDYRACCTSMHTPPMCM